LGLRWLAILPYYKRISFVLFLMQLSHYLIGFSDYRITRKQAKTDYECFGFHCRKGEVTGIWQQILLLFNDQRQFWRLLSGIKALK